MTHDETFQALSCGSPLPANAAQKLLTQGFAVLPGPSVPGGLEQLQSAYDSAVASADPSDVRVGSSIRVTDFVNRSMEFDGHYVYPPLLSACCLLIGGPFKLSNTCARTLEPGTPAQKLHTDVKHRANGWPLVGYIWMIDAFDTDNGATRFVAGSHRRQYSPDEIIGEAEGKTDDEMLACGPAGSLIVFDASAWHGHAANRSARRRRSVQGHFVPRDAEPVIDYPARMRPETLGRIGALARYLLDLPDAQPRGQVAQDGASGNG